MSRAFAFGDEEWPGIAKLVEECGEVIQIVGKLMMTHGSPAHWSGDLRTMLLEEVADIEAAVVFFMRHNPTDNERRAMVRRITEKVNKFEGWHADMDADPPPAIADRNPVGGYEVPSRSDESGGSRSEIAQNPRKSVVYGRTA